MEEGSGCNELESLVQSSSQPECLKETVRIHSRLRPQRFQDSGFKAKLKHV